MDDTLTDSIRIQTDILFKNIESTIDSIDESNLYNESICDWPIGVQIYHFLHSLDQWYINPFEYQEPSIAEFYEEKNGNLSKVELTQYALSIKTKISDYLNSLDSTSFTKTPNKCNFNIITLILGQFRHLMYHIGFIHGCLRANSIDRPKYYGLGPNIRPIK